MPRIVVPVCRTCSSPTTGEICPACKDIPKGYRVFDCNVAKTCKTCMNVSNCKYTNFAEE